MSVSSDQKLISKPLNELLEEFGSADAVPGSGSAAALLGMLACELCLAVIKRTMRPENRERYSAILPKLEGIEERLQTLEAKMQEHFHDDSDAFARVIEVRLERKLERKKRGEGSARYKELSALAQSLLLGDPTEIPLEGCRICLEICEYALYLFDNAFQSSAGDSGAAASFALSGSEAALFVCYLNLKDAQNDQSVSRILDRCERVLQRTRFLQVELAVRLDKLRKKVVRPSDTLPLVEGLVSGDGKSDRPYEQQVLQFVLPTSVQDELPLAARTSASNIDKPTRQVLEQMVASLSPATESDDVVFERVFEKYAKGKNREVWFKSFLNFFNEQGLGTFAENEDFLLYLRPILYAKRLRPPLKSGDLKNWYKELKDREMYEG